MPARLLRAEGPFHVYLESNRAGRTVAHVPQLPGCMVRAFTADLAVANVEAAIRQHIIWLASHSNNRSRSPTSIHINIAEQCRGGAATGSGSRVALLSADVMPISRNELREYLRRMRFSRKDLLDIVAGIPEEVLASRPPKPHRSIREILQHIAGAEQCYLTRLMRIPRFEPQPTPFERLKVVRKTAYSRLLGLEGHLSGKVVTKSGEAWTLRKVLRRFLEHEREHILGIEWRLHQMGLPCFPGWMPGDVRRRELRLAEVFQFWRRGAP